MSSPNTNQKWFKFGLGLVIGWAVLFHTTIGGKITAGTVGWMGRGSISYLDWMANTRFSGSDLKHEANAQLEIQRNMISPPSDPDSFDSIVRRLRVDRAKQQQSEREISNGLAPIPSSGSSPSSHQ